MSNFWFTVISAISMSAVIAMYLIFMLIKFIFKIAVIMAVIMLAVYIVLKLIGISPENWFIGFIGNV